jgi:GDP-mannose 6-dehydrogenase
MKVAVLGLGYVGTMTAAGLARCGHTVVGVDVDPDKVAAINAGQSPVIERGIDELVAAGVSAGTLLATCDLAVALDGADVSIVCVGTPSQPSGKTDLSFVVRVLDDLSATMSRVSPPASGFHCVVVRSTVPPGTGDTLVEPRFAAGAVPEGWRVSTAMCPEFLREGVSVSDFFNPPLVVIGARDEPSRKLLAELFSFVPLEPHYVEVGSAEALKYACNAFHANKITFANEMARLFRTCGIDAREVMEVFCQDDKLNLSAAYLRPGFAYGGSCLPKAIRALQHIARAHDVDVPQLNGTSISNDLLVREVVDRVLALADHRVTLFGLSFKMDTDDLRESPNVEVAERLIGKGIDLKIFDPILNPEQLIGANLRHIQARLPHLTRLLASSPVEALQNTELAVVAIDHHTVIQALLERPPRHILDLSGRLGSDVGALPGYEGIGW